MKTKEERRHLKIKRLRKKALKLNRKINNLITIK